MNISKLEGLFWLQFLLLVIGSTHLLTVYFLAVPLAIGVFLFVNLVVSNKIVNDQLTWFFCVLLVGYVFRSFFTQTIMQFIFFQDVAMILSSYGLVHYFQRLKLSIFSYYCYLFLLLITSVYFVVGFALGIPALVSVKVFFQSGSYHIVTWLFLLLIGVFTSFRPTKSILPYALFFLMSVALGGRSGMLLSALIVALAFLELNKNRQLLIKIGTLVLLGVIVAVVYTTEAYLVGDFATRSMLLGPRSFIWLCYFDNLTLMNFVTGFDVNSLEACISPHLGNNSLESSLFSLQYNIGIFVLPAIYILVLEISRLWKRNRMAFFLVMAMLGRCLTGEFVFITSYDWLFLLVVFSHSRRVLYK